MKWTRLFQPNPLFLLAGACAVLCLASTAFAETYVLKVGASSGGAEKAAAEEVELTIPAEGLEAEAFLVGEDGRARNVDQVQIQWTRKCGGRRGGHGGALIEVMEEAADSPAKSACEEQTLTGPRQKFTPESAHFFEVRAHEGDVAYGPVLVKLQKGAEAKPGQPDDRRGVRPEDSEEQKKEKLRQKNKDREKDKTADTPQGDNRGPGNKGSHNRGNRNKGGGANDSGSSSSGGGGGGGGGGGSSFFGGKGSSGKSGSKSKRLDDYPSAYDSFGGGYGYGGGGGKGGSPTGMRGWNREQEVAVIGCSHEVGSDGYLAIKCEDPSQKVLRLHKPSPKELAQRKAQEEQRRKQAASQAAAAKSKAAAEAKKAAQAGKAKAPAKKEAPRSSTSSNARPAPAASAAPRKPSQQASPSARAAPVAPAKSATIARK